MKYASEGHSSLLEVAFVELNTSSFNVGQVPHSRQANVLKPELCIELISYRARDDGHMDLWVLVLA